VEPVKSPPSFEGEGVALSAAIAWLILEHRDRLNLLSRAATDLWQTVESENAKPRYPAARAMVQSLVKMERLPAELVEEMRALSKFKERDFQKLLKKVAG